MKVQCDVCEKAQATVLCCADEASLCAECDTRVHAANKLASKHQRVPLLYPSPQDLPCCDICQDIHVYKMQPCNLNLSAHLPEANLMKIKTLKQVERNHLQEKTGYFFCLEDRALLCRNCDFSIHSTNVLAANHKRFLVSGIRVALQVISASDIPESMQTCSPSQGSSPTTQASQLSSPSTQISQLSSPRSALTPKTPRMTPLPSVMIKTPHGNSLPIGNVTKEESLSKVPSLSLPKQEQQQLQHATPTTPQHLRHVASAGVFPSKVISASATTLPSSSFSQQSSLNGGRLLLDWGVHTNTSTNSHDVSKGEMSTSQRGGGGAAMRRSSISEYLTESIPGWRVDELLNLPDMDSIYNFPGSGAAKTDILLFRDDEWPAECDLQGEAVVAEVPSLPSPPTASGVPRSTKPWGFGKSLKEPDLDFLLQCDDSLVVPDIGGVSSPPSLSPSSLPQKRRRALSELEGVYS